ncbi:hypothetical protein GCM10010967_48790 [Dyadobacter beijingensis]|uniref:histidine kinase n=1 Tax=Dyadobacter beijingensis TaxID=365489 RepID=A0ABQ2IGI3_9BACT|nr:sensor histidine kinase [Dyadobacter beijingensis]GGN07450.1 hypothetical protein GCM10010967_48790 [Dyadobacter beijingensis]
MNREFYDLISMRLVAGVMAVVLALLCACAADAQPGGSGYNDVARQRLLIRITAQYLQTISQGQIDMDSAILIPCRVYGLSPLLAYNEGYSDGKPTEVTRLLDAGHVKDAQELAARQNGLPKLRSLIELGTYFVFKPGTEKGDLDQAFKNIGQASILARSAPGAWKVECLMLKAHWLHQSGLAEESKKAFTELAGLCERSGDRMAYARAMLAGAEVLRYGDPDRLPKFEKALAIFTAKKSREKEIETLSLINIENFVNKRYGVAEQYLSKIIGLQTAIRFRQRQYPYDALSWLAYRKGELTNALTYSNKSLACVATREDSTFIGLFYTRRGLIFDRMFKLESAMTWFDKALVDRKRETRLYWYRALIGKVWMLNNTGRAKEALALLTDAERKYPPTSYFEKMHFALLFGNAYENLKNFNLAEDNYNVFLTMAERFPLEYVHDEFPAAFFQISAFNRVIGKTSKARDLLEKGRQFVSALDIMGKGNYHYNLFKIDSLDGRYLDAIRNLRLSYEAADSVFTNDQRRQASELLVKYEAEKKDKDIKLLNSQNQLQAIRVEQADRAKNVTFVVVALLLIIIGLILNRYLIKQRTNRQLEANQRQLEANQGELDRKNSYLEALNTEQEKLIKEKEWLIREVHHRVKNNLQMVTSLLNTQSAYLADGAAVVAVQDSLRRMQAMSLIHQKLYLDENTTTIAMPEYIQELVSYLAESFDTANRVSFEQTIEEIHLEVSQAIPLGLIINESIVNAMKYAFLNDHSGKVRIALQHDRPGKLLLRISDNGIGLPAELDPASHHSLGMDLMQGLARQLKGTFDIESDQGVHITVRFAYQNRLVS